MTAITQLGLSAYIVTNLTAAGYTDSTQLEGMSRDDLIDLPGIGEVSADAILAALAEEPPPEPTTPEINPNPQPEPTAVTQTETERILIEACEWIIMVLQNKRGQQSMFLASRLRHELDRARDAATVAE